MITIKYDLVSAVLHGYTGTPNQTMQDLGYFFKCVLIGKNSYFFEVDKLIQPLHPFLENVDIVDGRFDSISIERT